MKKIFEFESELVSSFIKNYTFATNEILVEELSIRFGNIDIVSIKKNCIDLTHEQMQVLAKPSNALVFTRIKNLRPITKTTLFKSLGLSNTTIESSLNELSSNDLIIKSQKGIYTRNTNYIFPKTIITGFEAKLSDFNKAFYQAKNNQEYVDYSYLIFPMNQAEKIENTKSDLLKKFNIGLIGVDQINTVVFIKASRSKKIKQYIRLLGIAKANTNINLHE
ncbi:hypothetical protein SFC11_05765 [Exiguobacterium indicum]|uniref:hypothetical protein n=1 Tax=Exiguobacterium indicum TaxID=296995 RepID=UPI003981C922